ncbi:MAG: dephospho-CoA kinase [Bdellovibrionales bacterium]|nr:dephospho-CoA kinase [Bdellovibrionales bacterium]
MMKWIGLTGGIATGKSTVTKRLRTLGYDVLDADEVSHRVTSLGADPARSALPQIFQTFGESVKNSDGSLNRKALGALVFGHTEERKKLEAIIHPLVRAQVAAEKSRLEKSGKTVAFYDVPLLYEKQMEKDFDAVVLVSTTEKLQLERLKNRNGFTETEALVRVQSQMPLKEKESKTPYVIHNTKDLAFLDSEIDRVLRALKIF